MVSEKMGINSILAVSPGKKGCGAALELRSGSWDTRECFGCCYERVGVKIGREAWLRPFIDRGREEAGEEATPQWVKLPRRWPMRGRQAGQ